MEEETDMSSTEAIAKMFREWADRLDPPKREPEEQAEPKVPRVPRVRAQDLKPGMRIRSDAGAEAVLINRHLAGTDGSMIWRAFNVTRGELAYWPTRRLESFELIPEEPPRIIPKLRRSVWRTGDRRVLYPYEMETTHLINTIAWCLGHATRLCLDAGIKVTSYEEAVGIVREQPLFQKMEEVLEERDPASYDY